MKFFFKWLLTPVLFWQMKNKKFVKIEIQYLAWSVACFFMTYRVAQSIDNGYPDSFGGWLVSMLFFAPFFLMAYLVIRAGINPNYHSLSDIPEQWKISRLSIARKWWYAKSDKEWEMQFDLENWFEEKYGVEFGEGRMHWLHKVQIIILIGSFFLAYFLGK